MTKNEKIARLLIQIKDNRDNDGNNHEDDDDNRYDDDDNLGVDGNNHDDCDDNCNNDGGPQRE